MDMDMHMSASTCNTSMLWNWNTVGSCFLAESWHISNHGSFAASCIGTVLLVITLEALRRLGREYDDWILRGFHARAARARLEYYHRPPMSSSSSPSASKGGLAAGAAAADTPKVSPASAPGISTAWRRPGGGGDAADAREGGGRALVCRASPLQQAFRSVIHAVILGLAYIIMLLVMSYNGYIIICVILGGGIGKFFCDWIARRYVMDAPPLAAVEEAAGIEEPNVCCG